jgi:hypothetical protein
MVPRVPGDASAGARLVFHHNPAVKPPLPPVRPAPVKLLVVEEDVIVD